MTNKEKIFHAALRQDLLTFVKQCWITLYPDKELEINWHIEAIIYHLLEACEGREPRLIVNLPPRHLKSFLISVVFPAWVLGRKPSLKVVCLSYADELSKKFTDQFRQIVHTAWYQQAFPAMSIGTKNTQTELVTTKNGGRFTTSILGTLTGVGGDIIIIDDPMKGEDSQSDKRRERVNDWFDSTLISRLDDKKKGVCILVMQRMHESDLTGYLEKRSTFKKLSFSAIATKDEIIPVGDGEYYERAEGEPLHEKREDIETLESIKAQMGSIIFSAQYQQEPVPAEGNAFKREWLRFYNNITELPANGVYGWSWDTASSISDNADYSVGTLWYVAQNRCFLIDLIRCKLEFTELRSLILSEARKHPGCAVIIEKASSGLALLQSLQSTELKLIPFPPKWDKETRVMRHLATFEAGQVLLPKNAPWLDVLLNELLAFPNAAFDDQVDSITQALEWADRTHNPYNVPLLDGYSIGVSAGRRYLDNLRDSFYS